MMPPFIPAGRMSLRKRCGIGTKVSGWSLLCLWGCACCAATSAWAAPKKPAITTSRPTRTVPPAKKPAARPSSAQVRKALQKALQEVQQMRRKLQAREIELKRLQRALDPRRKPVAKPHAATDKPSQRPSNRPTARELQALKDAFRTKPRQVTPPPTRRPKLRTPGDDLKALKDAFRNAPVEPTRPTQTSPPPVQTQLLPNAMNPAISALGVFAAGWTNGGNGHCHADGACFGQVGVFGHTHDPIRTGLNLQQVEVTFQATVDPYFTAFVVLSFGEGEGIGELEIEEAFMETTSLPWRLQVKAGKFLSSLTRLGSKHLHDLDFVTIALPLLQGAGGELFHYALQLTWLAPLPFYLRLGAEVSYGGSILYPIQDPSLPVVVGHMRAFFDLSNSTRLLIGGGASFGIWDRSEATAADLSRIVASGHIMLEWKPPQRGRFLALKVLLEYYGNGSQCDPRKTDTKRPQQRQYCVGTNPNSITTQWLHGFTTKAILRFAQRWQAGVRVDWMQQREPSALRPTHRLTAALTLIPTEFSRIRLEYNIANPFDENGLGHALWLQLQFSIGAHGAHNY